MRVPQITLIPSCPTASATLLRCYRAAPALVLCWSAFYQLAMMQTAVAVAIQMSPVAPEFLRPLALVDLVRQMLNSLALFRLLLWLDSDP